jgi:hypothetical protein
MRPIAVPLALAAALAATGCARTPRPDDWVRVREITPTTLEHRAAADPAVAADDHGRVALTWVTSDSLGGLDVWLALSSDSGVTFGVPRRLNAVPGRVSSYAESRPLPAWGPGGRLAVAWAELRADTGMAADVVVRASADAGASWGTPVTVNDDVAGRPVYHGFPALAWLPDGTLFAAWMDGRHTPPGEEESVGALVAAVSPDGGRTWEPNVLVTDQLCPCCRPAAQVPGEGRVVLAYRTALHDMRDPVLAFSGDGGRTFRAGVTVSPDGWELDACPSDGPALTGEGYTGVVAWYTGVAPEGVYLAPWEYGRGAAGLRRALGDSLEHAAHPRLARLGAAPLVAVVGRARGDSTDVMAVRALDPDGSLTPWAFLGTHVRTAWLASQPPRAALACWVERERGVSRVRLARLTRAAPRR